MDRSYPYVIRQGDHLKKLAHLGGWDADAVWNHELNQALREKRGDGSDLLPGDILFVPEIVPEFAPLSPGSENAFVAVIPRILLSVLFEDPDGPLSSQTCVVYGLPGTGEQGLDQVTDDQGGLELMVPVTVAELTVTFAVRHRSFHLRIGHMDPLNEQPGHLKRLGNLGYLDLEAADIGDGHVAAALATFQHNTGLDVTGQPDEATLSRLDQEAALPTKENGTP